MNIGTKWYTNGVEEQLFHKGETIPIGWKHGRLKSKESTKRKVSKSLIGNQRKKGKKESKSTRDKKSRAMIGNKNSTGQDNHGHIGLIHIHKGDRGRKCKPEELDSYLARGYELGESPKHVHNKRANHSLSKPELEITGYLTKKGIRVISQYQIPGKSHHFDFYLPDYNLLAEFDGSYWHQGQDYENDSRKILAKDSGYNYLVIKEHNYVTEGRLRYAKSRFSEFIDILRSSCQINRPTN